MVGGFLGRAAEALYLYAVFEYGAVPAGMDYRPPGRYQHLARRGANAEAGVEDAARSGADLAADQEAAGAEVQYSGLGSFPFYLLDVQGYIVAVAFSPVLVHRL
jgi:hypothetical protein